MMEMGKKKVLVIGVDGLSCGLVNSLTSKGAMPNLAGMLGAGSLRQMNSTVPEVSSTAWTTLTTGVNPGKHDIYGFMDLEEKSYRLRFPDSGSVKSERIWDMLGRRGMRSIIINLPSTYPARSMNGILAAGFVALDMRKAIYPDSAYEYLKKMDYRLDVDTTKASVSMDALFDDIMVTLDRRTEAILHLLDDEWDLFMGIVTETDRLHHFLWTASHEDDPRHVDFLDFYGKVDAFIGAAWAKAAERYGDDVGFLIVSDHGFTDIKQEVYVNTFLREKGYLGFRSSPPKSLEEIASGSRAFALDPSRIYINRRGRFPMGVVEEGDYEALRKELKEKFLELTFEGEKVIKDVFFREDLYSGHCLQNAPDIVLLSHRGYDLKGALAPSEVFGKRVFTGAHTRDDAVFYLRGPAAADPTAVEIADVTPTILDLMGLEDDMQTDGISRAR